MVKLFYVAVWVITILSAGAHAQAPVPLSGGFQEIVRKEVNTSGVTVVAAMVDTAPSFEKGRSRDLFIWLPETDAPRLCASIESIDGLYAGIAEFDISKTPPGRYEIDFETRQAELINKFEEGELVTNVRIASECSQDISARHIPAGWVDGDSSTIAVMLNASGNDAAIFVPSISDPNMIDTFECNSVETDRPKRLFDTVCSVEIDADSDLSESWLEISRFGRRLVWENLDIVAEVE